MDRILDPKQRLALRKVFKRSIKDPAEMLWSELHETRSSLRREMENLLERCETETRDLNETEDVAFKAAENLLHELDYQFTFRAKHGIKDPLPGGRDAIVNPIHRPDVSVSPDGRSYTIESREDSNPRSYRSMFYGEGRTMDNGGFESLREFFSVLTSGRYDARLDQCMVEGRAMLEGTGSAGGYAVPAPLAALILDKSLEGEIIRPRANVYPMESATLGIPAFDSKDHSNLFGGLALQWIGEGATADIQDAKLRTLTLNARSGVIYINASMELLADSRNFDAAITAIMAQAIGAGLDLAFISGNGAGKPQGLLSSSSSIAVNRATANQISYADLRGMYGRLHPAFAKNARWFIATDAVPELMNVSDGNGNLIWMPGGNGSISNPVPQSLFGLPVVITEKVPSFGSSGDVVLCDPTQYAVGLREGLVIESTNSAFWKERLISFRAIVRTDGQSLWDGPIVPMNGSGSTLSWCVYLDVPA